jgi:hypothetical protein
MRICSGAVATVETLVSGYAISNSPHPLAATIIELVMMRIRGRMMTSPSVGAVPPGVPGAE